MEKRPFGKTGLQVTPIGFGAAEIGYLGVPQNECTALLTEILDLGINVIDTAACYADSEAKIGPAISARRKEFILSTKCGHHVEADDPAEWTPQVVRKSAERSLHRLRVDYLDVLLLHSCAADKLRNDAMIEALIKCKSDGLTRWIGYSGDAAALSTAIDMNVFDCIETSVNFVDQSVIDQHLPQAQKHNLGVIAKRPLANACWRQEMPGGYSEYARPYIERLGKMGFTPQSMGFDGDWAELALRFTVFQPGVHVGIIGGHNIEHIKANIAAVEKGPLPESVLSNLRQVWKEHAAPEWVGQT